MNAISKFIKFGKKDYAPPNTRKKATKSLTWWVGESGLSEAYNQTTIYDTQNAFNSVFKSIVLQ
jgi:hypothetical protein